MGELDDALDTLGLDRSAAPEDLRRAYRRLLKAHHPDHGGDGHRLAEVLRAEQLVRTSFADDGQLPGPSPDREVVDESVPMPAPEVFVLQMDPAAVFSGLAAAIDDIGAVIEADEDAGRLEGVVQVDLGPPAHLRIDVIGETDPPQVLFTLDPTDDRPPPPIEAVVRTLAAALGA